MTDVTIKTPFIRLCDFLKFAGLCGTGGEAKTRIQAGEVLVDGEICTQRGRKLLCGHVVSFLGKAGQYRVANNTKQQ